MPKKRKVDSHLEISKIDADPTSNITVDRNEILKLTKEAKSWDFTCTFCFKRFPSAQAMGGHQNAHKGERLEEKRLFVKDPIGYRKRAYLLAMKSTKPGSSHGSSSSVNLHAMVKHGLSNINDPQNILIQPNYLPGDSGELNALSNNNHCQPDPLVNGENLKQSPLVLMNFLPPKELSLAVSVGSYAEDAKAMACVEPDIGDGNHGMNFEKLDLTLKL